jgi:hypothetical protein
VQVRCTSSSVSVAVSGRYLLQLSLPFRINDEAESVKLSSKKQPATLTVTMTVEGSIQQQLAANPPLPRLSPPAAAAASSNSSSVANKGSKGQRGQQQQQQAAEAMHSSSSSSSATPFVSDEQFLEAVVLTGPMHGDDKRQWLLPLALIADVIDKILYVVVQPPPDVAQWKLLLPLLRIVVLGVLAVLLHLSITLASLVFVLVSGHMACILHCMPCRHVSYDYLILWC